MLDKVELVFGNQTISNFVSYSVDSNIYQAAGAFDLELKDDVDVRPGEKVMLRVARQVVLHGIVDKVNRGGTKQGRYLRISGRDLMGLVVDWACERHRTLQNVRLRDVAAELLPGIPQVQRCEIVYEFVEHLDVRSQYVQIEPGQTVFDVLHDLAVARGVMFYYRYGAGKGQLVFGKPAGQGAVRFTLSNGKTKSDVLSWDYTESIAGRCSRLTVFGQTQSYDALSTSNLRKKAALTDAKFPFAGQERYTRADRWLLREKPAVLMTDKDAVNPTQLGKMAIEQQRADGRSLKYTLPGHTQNGKVWASDTLCQVTDESLGIREAMLVYGRTFSLSKDEGPRTEILLGPMGVVR